MNEGKTYRIKPGKGFIRREHTMDDKTREKAAEQIIETVHSLENALTIAGGGDCASLETMKGMSLFHFICHIAAPNGIRFVRVPPEDKGAY